MNTTAGIELDRTKYPDAPAMLAEALADDEGYSDDFANENYTITRATTDEVLDSLHDRGKQWWESTLGGRWSGELHRYQLRSRVQPGSGDVATTMAIIDTGAYRIVHYS